MISCDMATTNTGLELPFVESMRSIFSQHTHRTMNALSVNRRSALCHLTFVRHSINWFLSQRQFYLKFQQIHTYKWHHFSMVSVVVNLPKPFRSSWAALFCKERNCVHENGIETWSLPFSDLNCRFGFFIFLSIVWFSCCRCCRCCSFCANFINETMWWGVPLVKSTLNMHIARHKKQ